jgi:hypothetical protein
MLLRLLDWIICVRYAAYYILVFMVTDLIMLVAGL